MRILSTIRAEPERLAHLRARNFHVDLVERDSADLQQVIPSKIAANSEILFCDHPPSNLDEMQSLRLIQLASVGTTQLDGLGLAERGIQVCNARGAFDVPIAEWNVTMMINLLRDMRGLIRNQETAVWDRDPRFQKELRGSIVGIWGYGGIGRETARLGKALGLTIHTLTRHPAPQPRRGVYCVPGTGDPEGHLPDRFFTPEEKESFLADLDFLILAMPLNPENEGIIGEAELAALPHHAFVLNPARGPLIEEATLLHALQNGGIAGAALDTHYHYPMPPDHPLWKMRSVILTPHISGSSGSPHFLTRTWDILSQNAVRFAKGDGLLNEVTMSD